MNLGAVAINVALEIALYVAVVLSVVTIVIRLRFSIRKRVLIPAMLFVVFPATTFACESAFFDPLFVYRHRKQNDKIPDIEYVSYRPDSTGLLRAVGPMSESAIEQWVISHSELKLQEVSPVDPLFGDAATFGVETFDRQYMTDAGPRGGRYRLYWKGGNVYVAYNSF